MHYKILANGIRASAENSQNMPCQRWSWTLLKIPLNVRPATATDYIVKIVFQSRKAESVSEGVGAVCMHFISLALSITGWIEQMLVVLLEKQLTSRHKH